MLTPAGLQGQDATYRPLAHKDATYRPLAQKGATYRSLAHKDVTYRPLAYTDATYRPLAHKDTTYTPLAHKEATYTIDPWGRGYKTVLSTLCSNSLLKPRFYTVLNAQRRSPNFLSTVSCSDLSTERPNPEYAQDHAQRRTQANKDGSSRRNWSIS